jgi:rhodanese-related sulfurtransferase
MVKNIFVTVCLVLLCLTGVSAQETEVKSLLPDAFYQAMQQNSPHLIFDVRDNTFYKKHKIPGALHMPDKATLHSCTDTLDRDIPLFIYCEVGFMSRIVSNLLIEEGFNAVYTLEKGINRWHKMGLPVEKISKKTKRKK